MTQHVLSNAESRSTDDLHRCHLPPADDCHQVREHLRRVLSQQEMQAQLRRDGGQFHGSPDLVQEAQGEFAPVAGEMDRGGNQCPVPPPWSWRKNLGDPPFPGPVLAPILFA